MIARDSSPPLLESPRPNALPRVVLLVAVTMVTWLPMAWLSSLAARQAGTTLVSGEFAGISGDQVPADAAAWKPVALPDDWRVRRPGAAEGWYRFEVPAEPREERAVYFPMVAMNAAVYWNGEIVGTGGTFDEPVARNWNRPLLLPLPPSGEPGTLHVRVKSDRADAGFLPRISVGSRDLLQPVYERAYFLRRTMLLALMVFRLAVAAVTIAVWLMWRKEAYYGWFGLCAVAWVVAELNLLVVDIPVTTPVWYWIEYTAIGWWGLFGVVLVLDFIGMPKPRLVRTLLTGCAIGTLTLGALALADSPWLQPVAGNVWLAACFVGATTLLRGVLQRFNRQPDAIEYHVVFVVTLSVLGSVAWDLAMQLGLVPRGGLNIPSLTSFVAITGMGWVLLRRFLRALRETRQLATGLEQLVHEKRAELERSYEQVRAAEHARILATERERVLRDMHEGIGSRLVSTLAVLEEESATPEQLTSLIRVALDDLRLVIDSLDPESELLPALAALRSRLEPRLAAAGIRVEWKVEDLPRIDGFGPAKLLQVLRLASEAFEAVLAAKGATRLVVRTSVASTPAGREALVEIEHDLPDASQGTPSSAMEARARAIGARLSVHRSAAGSAVRLAIPCAT